MTFLLDTNVVSEWRRPRPDAGVVAWLRGVYEDDLYLSVVSIAEISHGVERLAAGRRRSELGSWLEHDVITRFGERIIPVDHAVAKLWGKIAGRSAAAGTAIGTMDAFIAATAVLRGYTLVTRNVSDFAGCGVALHNPWTGTS